MSNITGGCRCGAVRYRSSEPPLVSRSCWCRDCQYWASGSATVNVFFAADTITVEGELRAFESESDSGNAMYRSFCPKCGTPVITGSRARPQVFGVRAGTLDDPSQFPPQSLIWTLSAPSWACFDPALPHVEGQPAPLV